MEAFDGFVDADWSLCVGEFMQAVGLGMFLVLQVSLCVCEC